MIVRAGFRVPNGITFKGRQLRVGDLKVHGEQIVTGGQIADAVTMTLYALAIPGAPAQQRVACVYRPCPDKSHPDFIQAIPFNKQCPGAGISPQISSLMLAAVAADLGGLGAAAKLAPPFTFRNTRAKVFRL